MIKKDFSFKIDKQEEIENFYTFDGIATTPDIDREQDIVLSSAYNIEKNIPVLFNHESAQPVGVTTSLRMENDNLVISAKMPKDDVFVRERIIPQMKIGSLSALSIGFVPNRKEIEYKNGVRVFKEIDLMEVSLVPIPANPNATVSNIKKFSLDDVSEIKSRREFENILRESKCFSNRACVLLASKCNFESESQQEELDTKLLEILNKLEK